MFTVLVCPTILTGCAQLNNELLRYINQSDESDNNDLKFNYKAVLLAFESNL